MLQRLRSHKNGMHQEGKNPGKAVQDMEVSGYQKSDIDRETTPNTVKSTLYNPIPGNPVDWKSNHQQLSDTSSDMLVLPALQNYNVPLVNTKFGKFCKGSVLRYQQPLECDCIINLYDGVGFPDIPVENS